MKPQIVSFHCVLKSSNGNLISSTFSRNVLTANPATEDVALPGLAKKMQNLHEGEVRKIDLEASEAYGLYDPALVVQLPRGHIAGTRPLRVGDEVDLGTSQARMFRVTGLAGGEVTLDANHPLAGIDLVFDIEVTAARDATEDEIREAPPQLGQRYLN